MTLRRLWITALLLAAACGGAEANAPPITPPEAGTYALKSVNGTPLPYLLSSQSGNSYYISSGAIALHAETKDWTMVTHESHVGPIAEPPGTTTLFGSYTIAGARISLTLAYTQGGGTLPATLNGDVLTVISGTRTMLFMRQ